jgi:insertion element IS1 protein InsB
VVPERHHFPVCKDEGETNHVGRFNNTLRQRLARSIRKTLSFSKCPFMHECCVRLFLHRYNLEQAAKSMKAQL